MVFLPGQDEIESLHALLDQNLPNIAMKKSTDISSLDQKIKNVAENDFIVRPLYASLSKEEQILAFKKTSNQKRKFILATNIAETSVTISGIKYGEP